MSSSSHSDSPPLLQKCKSYQDWLKLLKIWCKFTTLPKTRQWPAIVLSLEGDAQEQALRISDDDISKDDGVDKIIVQLNELYLKDTVLSKFETLESFETFKRTSGMSLSTFLNEFDKRLHNTKTYGIEMSDDVLGYRLLKAANLNHNDEHLIKATLTTTIAYKFVKQQLKRTFSDSGINSPAIKDEIIKPEDTYMTTECTCSAQFN